MFFCSLRQRKIVLVSSKGYSLCRNSLLKNDLFVLCLYVRIRKAEFSSLLISLIDADFSVFKVKGELHGKTPYEYIFRLV